MTPDVAAIAARAKELIAIADGFEAAQVLASDDGVDAAHVMVARRMRVVARDLLYLVLAYQAEQDARVAMQASYERAIAVIQSRGYAQHIARRDVLDAETPTAVEGGNPLL